MKKNYALFVITFLCAILSSYGQLSPGDIAFVQYNADGTDNFSFIALVDIPNTEVIHFTDNEENDLTGGEGTITWTPPAAGITCGTIVFIETTPSASVGTVSEVNDLNFNATGDFLLAYQGTTASPVYISAMSNDGGAWGGGGDGNLPAGLVDGVSALTISTEVDNCALDIVSPTSGTQAALLAIINSNSNWTLRNNTTQQTFTDSFVVTDCSTDTRVEFTSITYSAGENNASINLCADIFNESATNDTTVDVVLVTGSAPHITYTTQTLTFLANDSTQQCATINISQNTNCGDSSTYTFELQSVSGGDSAFIGTADETILTVNDDDGTAGPFSTLSFEAGDDWGYTPFGGSVSSIANKFFGTQSYELTGNNYIVTDNIDISTYTNVTLSVAFAAVGPDAADDLFLDISYDNGTTWMGTGSIKLVDGSSDANIDIGNTNALNPTTVASNPWTVSIAPAETQVRARLRAAGLEINDYYYVDDIILSGETCVVACTPTHSVSSFIPTSGPAGTQVIINGSGFTALTDVEFNGVPAANLAFIDATKLIVEVPSGATTGEITIIENLCEITTTDFTVINNSGNCASLDDLIMTEIYDAPSFSLGYIEVYNGTGAAINLTNYFIRRYGDMADFIADDYTDYTFTPGATIIADGAVIYGKISSDADVATPDFSYGNAGFSGINGEDIFELRDNTGAIDVYSVPNNNVGFTALRDVNTGGPDLTGSDWTHNTTESTADLGNFSYVGLSSFPVVDTSPSDVTSCSAQAIFTTAATPGDGGSLTYQWYYNEGDGLATGWTLISGDFPLATVSGETTNQLTINGGFVNYNNYQFYCLVTENGTCSSASDAAQIDLAFAVWSSSGWSSPPTINKIAIINFDYDTSDPDPAQVSFSACSLTINNDLNIANGDYVEVNFDLIVNGTLDIQNEGSLVMIEDSGTVTNNGTTNVHKTTTDMETYDYTYWSPPVDYSSSGTTAQTVLAGFRVGRIYSFNTSQFFDIQDPDGVPGADGFDDNQDAWTNHYSFMSTGIGYAAMTNGTGVHQRSVTFNGRLNTGIIPVTVALSGNNSDATDDWNLLGNPYPSAIFVDDFVDHNANLDGTVYLWTHEDDISPANPGPDGYNFNSNDYAMYNRIGGIGTASTGNPASSVPTGYIASGQGFFIDANAAGTIEFTNAMRDRTYSNNDFFRNTESNSSAITDKDRMWINMTNPDGAFTQILIGYMEDGTLGKDRLYDGIRLEGSNYIDFYSKDETNLYKYGIQGRPSFTIEDVIPIGYDSNILGELTISLATTEGVLNDVIVFLRDNQLQTIHNLTESDYIFTTANGSFSDRFEIVYQTEALSIKENEINANQLSIIELQNGSVEFSVGNNLTIDSIEIIDLLGRTLYNLIGNSSSEIFELNNLSQAVYIAKVRLSNGHIITKQTVKRK